MKPIALAEVGFSTRTFSLLRSLGVTSLQSLVSAGPGTLPARATTWADVVKTLAQWKGRRSDLADPIDGFLAQGGRARAAKHDASAQLAGLEGLVQSLLQSRQLPTPLKQLKERLRDPVHRLVDLGERLLAHPAFVVYPYGRARLVGLAQWGERGYLQAAELTYNLLPLQLEQWRSDGVAVQPEALAAVTQLAQQREDRELAQLCARLSPSAEAEPEPPQLKLFAGLPAHFDSSREALERIHQAAPQREWSLCELRVSEGDWLWLQDWARSVQPANLGWLQSTYRDLTVLGTKRSRQEGFGLLVLLLACEEARRHAREGHVWHVIPPCFSAPAREELFTDGQPRPPLRDAIEAAALRTRLRNAFGIEGSQAWYLTIFLQFGFTRKGIDSLPYWLSSDHFCTQAVGMLLSSSDDFRALWQALRLYRSDPSRVEQARHALEHTAFILPEWTEPILRAAACEYAAGAADTEVLEPPLFGPARLLWPGYSRPRCLLALSGSPPALVDSGYDLMMGEDFLGRLLRLPQGGYELDPPELEVELTAAELAVTALGDSLNDRHDFLVPLLDLEEDVLFFDAETGVRRAGHQLSPQRSLLVLTDEDHALEPPASSATRLPLGKTLHYLGAGWPPTLELTAGGVTLGPILSHQPAPPWLEKVFLVGTSRPVHLGEEVELSLAGLPPGARLVSARFQSARLPVDGERASVRLSLDARLSGCRPGLRLVIEKDGRRHRLYRSCVEPLRLLGVTRLVGEGWQVLQDQRQLPVEALAASRFRFFLAGEPTRDWAVLEGDVFTGRPRAQASRLQRPAGYGGALSYGRGPYNQLDAPAVLVREVNDHGCLAEHRCLPEGLEIRLTRPIEGDSRHLVVVWLQDGWSYTARASDLTLSEGQLWSGDVFPEDASEQPTALGLAYEGKRIGSQAMERFLPDFQGDIDLHGAACLVRWLHLPVAASRWRKGLATLVERAPLECLRAWVLDRHFMLDNCRLVFTDESVAWLSAVRRLFSGWRPSPEGLKSVARGLLAHGRMEETFLVLLRVDPLLAVRLATSVCQAPPELLLLSRLATHDQPLDELVNLASRLSQADPGFIRGLADRIVQGRLATLDADNYRMLCQVESFSRYMAARALERMQPGGGRTAPRPA